jgi:hypothetical protein
MDDKNKEKEEKWREQEWTEEAGKWENGGE